jgi:hypothetical protein
VFRNNDTGPGSVVTDREARKVVGTGKRDKQPSKHSPQSLQAWCLHYGSAQSPIVVVVPDGRWPGMYRVAWPNGQLSDFVNLSRAKDAAAAICLRDSPERNWRLFRWKLNQPETHANGASPRLRPNSMPDTALANAFLIALAETTVVSSDCAPITIRPGVVANTVRHSVTRDGVEVFLSPQLFEIFLRIGTARYGATPAQLFDAIYNDSPDGGPLTGRKAVQVQRVNLNRKIAPLGLRIKSAGSGFRDCTYELGISDSDSPPPREPNEMPAARLATDSGGQTNHQT